jgi:prepilin-type N-terminal cleavage/methylation domain-containing protein
LGGKRKGFTLVEVIVVLVILVILAAIAIPALTGYIDKADDKKYIAKAREILLAEKTTMDEAYAEKGLDFADFKEDSIISSSTVVYWTLSDLPIYYSIDLNPYVTTVYDLLGGIPIANYSKNYWELLVVGPANSTAFQCDGFVCLFYPEGSADTKTARNFCMVTYKTSCTYTGGKTENVRTAYDYFPYFAYDATQGYTVYKSPTFSG